VCPITTTTHKRVVVPQSHSSCLTSFPLTSSPRPHSLTPHKEARFSAAIDSAAKAALLEGALAVRKLVRVKLSDEADLQQGTRAIIDTDTFLRGLCALAQQDGQSPYAVLHTL
jgi:hypothetical protein